MDGQRFDHITKSLAIGKSRRNLLKSLVGSLAAAGVVTAGREQTLAAPDQCSVACASEPGPRKAACKQACKECGGRQNVCSTFSSFTCCPGAAEGTSQCCYNRATDAYVCCVGRNSCCYDNLTGTQYCCPVGTQCRYDSTIQNNACVVV